MPAPLLPRAVALATMGQQLVTLIGPATGGLVVHQFGLRGSALAETVGATAMSVLAVRFRGVTTAAAATGDGSLRQRLLGGLRVVAANRVLLLLVLSLVALAGFVLPITSFLVPVLARHRSWDVQQAGFLSGALTAGAITVTTLVARSNGSRRPGIAAGAGLAVTAVGLLVLALSPSVVPALAAMIVVGAGISLYSGHLAPIMLTAAPATHLSRVQAVLLVAQSAPLLLVTLILGAVATAVGATAAAVVCAGGVGLAALLLLGAPELRRLQRPGAPAPGV